ncbi:dymeclin [Ciona intestinalis]
MGIGCSSFAHLEDNEYLKRLSSNVSISENDPFWNQLFSFTLSAPRDRNEAILLEEATETFCKMLVDHNQHTGNFTSLLKVFLSRFSELKSSAECDDQLFIWQSKNAMFVIQHLCKFLAENTTEMKMMEQFGARSLVERQKDLTSGSVFEGTENVNYAHELLSSLMDIIIHVPILDFTYSLHIEALNTILVLLSVQMFVPSPGDNGPIYRILMTGQCAAKANNFMRALLQNFIEQRPSPEAGSRENGGGSFVIGFASAVASGLWSALKLGGNKDGGVSKELTSELGPPTIGRQSALLILALINHQSYVDPTGQPFVNPYKTALCCFRHVQGQLQGPSNGKQKGSLPSFHINLSRLYGTACSVQVYESSTLLLYSLLHGNQDVKAFVLSKTDIDSLVTPILQILYFAPSQNSHHIYMALIILLMFTEDDHFNKYVHDIRLPTVPWYTDRILSDISLGDLIILVVIRTIQFNMSRMRDRYLHTNCLAALANMSAHFRSLHPYAAQRIFSLVTLLTKKYRKLTEKVLALMATSDTPGTVSDASATSSEQAEIDMEPERDYASNLKVLEEVLRMLLEIVNSCLTGGALRHNANLVYALLQRREAFDQLRLHTVYQDVLQNIDTVINFFTGRLDQLNQQTMTTDEVHSVIKDATVQLPSHRLHKFPDLKFRYVEEDSPEEFFVPYVWSLIFNKSGLFWNPGCVQLFALES